jgi:hypothetical protein
MADPHRPIPALLPLPRRYLSSTGTHNVPAHSPRAAPPSPLPKRPPHSSSTVINGRPPTDLAHRLTAPPPLSPPPYKRPP